MRSLAVIAVIASGCATTTVEQPPRISVVVDDVGAIGPDCGGRVLPVRGPRPEGTRVVATVTVSADRPVALESLEQATLVPALRRCATGLSVLRAEAADGTDGYVSATAEAWVEADVEAAPPAPDASPPAATLDG
jgi:hypothetical protein